MPQLRLTQYQGQWTVEVYIGQERIDWEAGYTSIDEAFRVGREMLAETIKKQAREKLKKTLDEGKDYR